MYPCRKGSFISKPHVSGKSALLCTREKLQVLLLEIGLEALGLKSELAIVLFFYKQLLSY